MEPRPQRLALWVLLLALGAATLLGELALFRVGLGADALGVPIVAMVVGLAYLAWAAPARPAPAPTPEDEPFDDPVEEAARADSARRAEPTGAPAPEPADATPPAG